MSALRPLVYIEEERDTFRQTDGNKGEFAMGVSWCASIRLGPCMALGILAWVGLPRCSGISPGRVCPSAWASQSVMGILSCLVLVLSDPYSLHHRSDSWENNIWRKGRLTVCCMGLGALALASALVPPPPLAATVLLLAAAHSLTRRRISKEEERMCSSLPRRP